MLMQELTPLLSTRYFYNLLLIISRRAVIDVAALKKFLRIIISLGQA